MKLYFLPFFATVISVAESSLRANVFADEAALRYTLTIVATGAGVVAFIFLLLNLRFYRRAIEEAEGRRRCAGFRQGTFLRRQARNAARSRVAFATIDSPPGLASAMICPW